ncbi:lipoyl synthase [candidate division KSB1 bacterium]|nr:lipoyl synthase [candidate division KSB1 bacterium]MBL7094577.1 lipoyl synthase [candidate division KSB1 bacterium]
MKIRQQRHPRWLKVPLPAGEKFNEVRKLLKTHKLNTVCQSAHCPNIGECWGHRTATFMILGNVCTRNCRFCAVDSKQPSPVDLNEAKRVAEAVKTLSLRYAVITSVTRDDLMDGGASIFADTIYEIRKANGDCKVEVLIPDLNGSDGALSIAFNAKPDILNHNIETVPSLYKQVRPQANYQRSLDVLKKAKKFGLITKSGLMLGLGETSAQVIEVMKDLRKVACDFLTLGQYLQPSSNHLPIDRYVTPEEFTQLKEKGLSMDFKHVEAGPLVRSSYHAAVGFDNFLNKNELDRE